jgi:hypothetical protein
MPWMTRKPKGDTRPLSVVPNPAPPDRIAALEQRVHELQTHVWMLESSLPQPDVDPSESEHERWTELQWLLEHLLHRGRAE